jgi:hypothetical protein
MRHVPDTPAGSAPGRQEADEVLGRGIEALPDSLLKRSLKQAGWVGLALGVLLGTVPWSFAAKSAFESKAPIRLETLETYWLGIVLFTPFVVMFAILGYIVASRSKVPISGAPALFGAAVLWWVATLISYNLGGTVPVVALHPPQGGPSGALTYIFTSIGMYVDYYGPLPVLAGPIEGAALGYWAAVLSADQSR